MNGMRAADSMRKGGRRAGACWFGRGYWPRKYTIAGGEDPLEQFGRISNGALELLPDYAADARRKERDDITH